MFNRTLDNSRDADAKNLWIYAEKAGKINEIGEVVVDEEVRGGGFTLNFFDDGHGMNSIEVSQMINFGASNKRHAENMIGQYGNGLKSASMRIAEDLIVFTKANNQITVSHHDIANMVRKRKTEQRNHWNHCAHAHIRCNHFRTDKK